MVRVVWGLFAREAKRAKGHMMNFCLLDEVENDGLES